jgi:hypothetical protein
MKTESHVRLTPLEVKALFDAGHLRPSGYIYLLLSALKQHGWKHRVEKIENFCDEWGISRSAFYRAKAKLIDQRLLSEEILGAVDIVTHDVPLSENSVPLSETAIPLSENSVPLSETTIPLLRIETPETPTNTELQNSLNSYSDLSSTFNSNLPQNNDPLSAGIQSGGMNVEFLGSRPNLRLVSSTFHPQPTLESLEQSPVNNLSLVVTDECSAAPPVDPVQAFIDIYNQDKPSRWAGCRKTSDLRTKWIKKFVKEHKAESTELFQKALMWAAQDSWWSSMPLGFDTLTHKGHVLEFAERWDAIASQPSSQTNVDDLVMNVLRKKFEEQNGRAANW